MKSGADLVALVDADRRDRATARCSRARRPAASSSSICWSMSSMVRSKTLTPPSTVGVSGLRASFRTSCGTCAKAGFCVQLRVVVFGAQDVGQLGVYGVAVDALEGRDEVAQVAPDGVASIDVVLGPARRDRATWRRRWCCAGGCRGARRTAGQGRGGGRRRRAGRGSRCEAGAGAGPGRSDGGENSGAAGGGDQARTGQRRATQDRATRHLGAEVRAERLDDVERGFFWLGGSDHDVLSLAVTEQFSVS